MSLQLEDLLKCNRRSRSIKVRDLDRGGLVDESELEKKRREMVQINRCFDAEASKPSLVDLRHGRRGGRTYLLDVGRKSSLGGYEVASNGS